MRILLDTHAFLWWMAGDPRLVQAARRAVAADENDIVVSAASAWEIATKHRLGRLPEADALASDIRAGIAGQGFEDLPVDRDEVDALLWDPMPGGSGLLDQLCERFGEVAQAAQQLKDSVDPETGQRFTIKRYRSEKTADAAGWRHFRIVLEPTNPDFEPVELTAEHEDSVTVVAEPVDVIGLDAPV